MMKYEIHYILYNCKNIIRFRELSQYTNWTYVMEKEGSGMIKRFYESDGTHKGETVFCPVNGWDCPHWGKGNICRKRDALLCLDFKSIFGSWEYWEQL